MSQITFRDMSDTLWAQAMRDYHAGETSASAQFDLMLTRVLRWDRAITADSVATADAGQPTACDPFSCVCKCGKSWAVDDCLFGWRCDGSGPAHRREP